MAVGRREVVFIDADASGAGPFGFEPVIPAADAGVLSLALSRPPCRRRSDASLRHRCLTRSYSPYGAYDFELGAALSDAAANLEAALHLLISRFTPAACRPGVDGVDTPDAD